MKTVPDQRFRGGGLAETALIQGMWYVAAPAKEVRRSGTLERKVCGHQLSLSIADGQASARPLGGGAPWPCKLSEDLIWVFFTGDQTEGEDPERVPVPRFDGPKSRVRFVETVTIPAHQDDAVYGLLDPAHTPFVHRSPIWRGNGKLKKKTKRFEPSELGFTMMSHAPVNSDIYKVIGGAIRVRIYFRLPGLRAEYIQNSKHTVLGLTALTPVDDRHTRLMQIFYWNSPVLNMARPFARFFAKPFLQQDVDIMALRRANEPYGGKGMLLGDSDRQFLWYLNLKKAWEAGGRCPAAFSNPLAEETLYWTT